MKAYEARSIARSYRFSSYLDHMVRAVDNEIARRAKEGAYSWTLSLHDFGYHWWNDRDISVGLPAVLRMRGYKVDMDRDRAKLTIDWEDAI